jgi:hypothetical protein
MVLIVIENPPSILCLRVIPIRPAYDAPNPNKWWRCTALKGDWRWLVASTLGGPSNQSTTQDVVEHALSKGATTVLVPISCRRGLVDLSDDVATKVQVLFYADAADALRKALYE